MHQRAQKGEEESAGYSREIPPRLPMGRIRRFLLSRKRRRTGLQGATEADRARRQGFVGWVSGFIRLRRRKKDPRNKTDVIVAALQPQKDHSQLPQKGSLPDQSASKSPAASADSELPRLNTGLPPEGNKSTAADFASELPLPTTASKVSGVASQRSLDTTTPPSALSISLDFTNTGASLQAAVVPPPPEVSASRESIPLTLQSMTALIEEFNEYKLETEFRNGYAIHRENLGSSKLWVTSAWRNKRKIGSGNFGTVFLQEKEEFTGLEGKQLRAVKMLPRAAASSETGPSQAPKAGPSEELLALIRLKEVGFSNIFMVLGVAY